MVNKKKIKEDTISKMSSNYDPRVLFLSLNFRVPYSGL